MLKGIADKLKRNVVPILGGITAGYLINLGIAKLALPQLGKIAYVIGGMAGGYLLKIIIDELMFEYMVDVYQAELDLLDEEVREIDERVAQIKKSLDEENAGE